MSRSNPNENGIPNPSTRWFEWNGEQGVVRYYDRDARKNVEVGADFTFLLLDQLGRVGGWHDASDSGIYSNEVKDTRQEVLVVKTKKAGTIAEGVYKDIRDAVKSQGGQFEANCYIAFKNGGGELAIGSIRFKGAALHAWAEFTKAHRSDIYEKAIRINGYTEGKKGRITFRVPILEIKEISRETQSAAVALDKEFQKFLTSYLKRTKAEQVEDAEDAQDDYSAEDGSKFEHQTFDSAPVRELTDDDIPFAWLLPFLVPATIAAHVAFKAWA